MHVAFKWDYTRWSFYDQCPFKYHEKYIARQPEGKPSAALLNGRKAHDFMEKFLKNEAWAGGYNVHVGAAGAVKEVIAQEDKLIEHKITLNRDWVMVPNKAPTVWLTLKMDVVYQSEDMEKLDIVDWKTGRTKADTYGEQLDLYRLVAATVWTTPWITAKIVNLDDGKTVGETMSREDALRSRDKWIERATQMETEQAFPMKPNAFCDWCPFGKSKGGRCRYG